MNNKKFRIGEFAGYKDTCTHFRYIQRPDPDIYLDRVLQASFPGLIKIECIDEHIAYAQINQAVTTIKFNELLSGVEGFRPGKSHKIRSFVPYSTFEEYQKLNWLK